MHLFERCVDLEASVEEAFAWHARVGALERLTPPWEPVEVVARSGALEPGSRVVLRVPLAGPLRGTWIAEHRELVPGERFRDVQVSGPFAVWDHTHAFRALEGGRSRLTDRVRYALPVEFISDLLAGRAVARKLDRMFAFRHRVLAADLAAHRRLSRGETMRILVTGASGLVGSALVPFLSTGGHDVVRLVRRKPQTEVGEIRWSPSTGELDPSHLDGVEAVVHLAGESIAEGRWNEAKKQRIRNSRVEGTRLLADRLAAMDTPPAVLVCASAIGFYGDRGGELLDEGSAPGDGFLAEVCRDWEAAAEPARAAGIRVVHLRIGVVLSPRGGALGKMLTPFKLGAGGRIGNGEQFMSWITLDDLVRVVLHAITNGELRGPVNAVAPEPVTNADFTRTLGRVLGRPTIFPVPAFAARLAFGEMADALLLSSARVEPSRLLAAGHTFDHPQLEDALRHLLGR